MEYYWLGYQWRYPSTSLASRAPVRYVLVAALLIRLLWHHLPSIHYNARPCPYTSPDLPSCLSLSPNKSVDIRPYLQTA